LRPTTSPRSRPRPSRSRWVFAALPALLAHLALLPVALDWLNDLRPLDLDLANAIAPSATPVQVTVDASALDLLAPIPPELEEVEAEEVEEPPPPEEPEPPTLPRPDGQIVAIARPLEERAPETSQYLAEYNQTVERETRTDAFKINPEVIAPQFSRETALQREELVDLGVDKPSTGARAGGDRFDPTRDGNLAALPTPGQTTNKEGIDDPVPASHTSSKLAGAPQNDLLREALGDGVALNTREYLYAGYYERIRTLVNFYWNENIDNLPTGVVLARSSYTTGVEVVLDGTGALDTIEVTSVSGSPELDDCVLRAFKMAGPFPNPPEGLIEKDGRVYLGAMSFTVSQGQARMQYQGVDPRAGVQFPGILKSPR
jgi:outer membrane biosynthesis protein TonB